MSGGWRSGVLRLLVAAVALTVVALVADVLVPAAGEGLPATIYVDGRIGDDDFDGRTPEQAFRTIAAAARAAPPGADILVMGYGDQLVYRGTQTRCVTLVGTAEDPVVIRRNSYTNGPNPTVLTANRDVDSGWRLESSVPVRSGPTDRVRTWSTPWPQPIRLESQPLDGFIKLGGITVRGYQSEPPAGTPNAAWWADGRLFIRHLRYDPNDFQILVKNGDGLCLSGESAHVRVKDLSVNGAVHAVRVEPGAVDVRIAHLYRVNVLDPDYRGDREGRK